MKWIDWVPVLLLLALALALTQLPGRQEAGLIKLPCPCGQGCDCVQPCGCECGGKGNP